MKRGLSSESLGCSNSSKKKLFLVKVSFVISVLKYSPIHSMLIRAKHTHTQSLSPFVFGSNKQKAMKINNPLVGINFLSGNNPAGMHFRTG